MQRMYSRPVVTSQDTQHVRSRIASNLRRAQSESGLTGRQVADGVGATPDQVSKWRRGEVSPSLAYLIRLAEVLSVEVAYFYADHHDEVPA